jgi:ribonuclease VapC
MAASRCLMSVATWVEVGIVADSRGRVPGARLDEIVEQFGIEQLPVTQHQAQVARTAYRRHGKGSGSPAKLNLGDCFSYALAVTEGRPLLFVGNHFTHTDIDPARY